MNYVVVHCPYFLYRCKLFMMWWRLDMLVTSECHPAGLTSVRWIYPLALCTQLISAVSSRHAGSVASARDDYTERRFSDYAIRNNLTPFISMQNHYNLVYREEEREMFTTLKVPFWFAELLVLMCQVAFWYWGYHMVSLSPRPSISSLRPANKARSIW